jgi:hypothetical protein
VPEQRRGPPRRWRSHDRWLQVDHLIGCHFRQRKRLLGWCKRIFRRYDRFIGHVDHHRRKRWRPRLLVLDCRLVWWSRFIDHFGSHGHDRWRRDFHLDERREYIRRRRVLGWRRNDRGFRDHWKRDRGDERRRSNKQLDRRAAAPRRWLLRRRGFLPKSRNGLRVRL